MEISARPTRSLYVHVPFCRSHCGYCDFYSVVLAEPRRGQSASGFSPKDHRVDSWLGAIQTHLAALRSSPDWVPYSSLYVGGGTPTVLAPEALESMLRLLAGVRDDRVLESCGEVGLEWTVECNPDDLDRPRLKAFKTYGVNRLSVGVQSLEDPVRKAVQRRRTAGEISIALRMLARNWKDRWSADLMYGMPFQTPNGLARDIRQIIDSGAGHISLYQLTVEEGTELARRLDRGSLSLPDPDLSADQYASAADTLKSFGYQRYEVSNWALPGQQCLHNLHYWNLDDWDALGPAAVSNRSGGAGYVRGQNPSDEALYSQDPPGSVISTLVDGVNAMFEFLMMTLRTRAGFPIRRFQDSFGQDPSLVFGDLPSTYPGLLYYEDEFWRPTDEGLDFLNRILVGALEAADHFLSSGQSKTSKPGQKRSPGSGPADSNTPMEVECQYPHIGGFLK